MKPCAKCGWMLKDSDVPDTLKVSMSVLTRAIHWLAWAFVIVGSFLNPEWFPYWLGFFLLIEGVLFCGANYTSSS